MTTINLLLPVKQHHCTNIFKVDKIITKYGYDVIRSPPYHSDLNSIELVWGDIKQESLRENVYFIKKIKLCEKLLGSYSVKQC